MQPTAVTVQSGTAGSVSMDVYVDGSATATATYSVTPGVPVRLAGLSLGQFAHSRPGGQLWLPL